jgi:hypothetical protein
MIPGESRANRTLLITEKQYKTEIHVTSRRRFLITFGCMLLAAIGAYLIERSHNWNPFGY